MSDHLYATTMLTAYKENHTSFVAEEVHLVRDEIMFQVNFLTNILVSGVEQQNIAIIATYVNQCLIPCGRMPIGQTSYFDLFAFYFVFLLQYWI